MASPTNTTNKSAAGETKGASINNCEDESTQLGGRETESLSSDAVNQDENYDCEADAFESLASRKRKKLKKLKKITPISIAWLTSPEEVAPVEEKTTAEAKPLPNVRALDYLKEKDDLCSGFDYQDNNLHNNESHRGGVNPDQLRLQDKDTAAMAEREVDLAKGAEEQLDDGLNWLKNEQKKELDVKMLNHQKDVQEGKLSQEDMQQWNISMAQLQACHQDQIKQFEEKKSKFIENKINAEQKLRDQSMNDENEQLKDKLMKSHMGKQTSAPSSRDLDRLLDLSFSHHTVTRHKRRKISTGNASVGMSLEIHNEGIIMMMKSCRSNQSTQQMNNVFVPWGIKARRILMQVVFGEVPSCSELKNIYCSGKHELDGGIVKCIITDMRTSEETAKIQRADAYRDLAMNEDDTIDIISKQRSQILDQITTLTREIDKAVKLEVTAVNNEKEAVSAHKGSRDTWTMFKAQAQHFFNNDGSCSSTLSLGNKQKLLGPMRRYKGEYEVTKNNLMASKEALEAARLDTQTKRKQLAKSSEKLAKIEAMYKKLLRGAKPGQKRVDNVITAIKSVADKRRSVINEKKTQHGTMCSKWAAKVEGFENELSTTTKSMQPKRFSTLLRPNFRKRSLPTMGHEDSTVPSLRAEELLLLALHPEKAPRESTNFHEPGWEVCLDVPQQKNHSILHTDTAGLLSQSFLSACCSTGRQTASFIKSHHLKTLDMDASVSKTIIETHIEKATVDADPLTEFDGQVQLGYSFVYQDDAIENKTQSTKRKSVKNESKLQHKQGASKSKSQPKNKKGLQKKKDAKATSNIPSQSSNSHKKSKASDITGAFEKVGNPRPMASTLENTMQQPHIDRLHADQKSMPEANNYMMNQSLTGMAHQPMFFPSLQQQQQQQQFLQQQQQQLQQQQLQQHQNLFMGQGTSTPLSQHQNGPQQQQLLMMRNIQDMQRQNLQNRQNYLRAQQQGLSLSQPQLMRHQQGQGQPNFQHMTGSNDKRQL